VSRSLAAFAGLALLALLGFAPGAAATDCAWRPHAQRTVRHVKRSGRVRRIVRVRHRWSCDPLPAAPVAPAPPATLPAPPVLAPSPEAEPPPRRVSVKAADDKPEAFSFSLSRLYVVSGEVTVELNNQGQDRHNLNVRLEGSADPPLEVGEAGPGESRVARLDLPAGDYKLFCSLPQHEEWGMKVDLEVRAG
jgi:hypothetical protein